MRSIENQKIRSRAEGDGREDNPGLIEAFALTE